MTTQTKRRIIGGVAATFITIGLFWGYQKYARASRMNELDRLSAQLREAPRDQREELSKKFRVQMAKLTPDERRDYFEGRMEVMEKQMDDRIDEYFKKTPEERKAWLDEMSKNRRRFGGPPGKGQRPTAKGKAKTGTAKGKTLAKGKTGGASREGSVGGRQGGGGRGGPGGGGGWGGGGGRGGSREQRAQRRRERLDKTSPEQRAKRSEFFAAMRRYRGGGGFGGGFGGGSRRRLQPGASLRPTSVPRGFTRR